MVCLARSDQATDYHPPGVRKMAAIPVKSAFIRRLVFREKRLLAKKVQVPQHLDSLSTACWLDAGL
jgi:hypothetical protein